MYPLETDSNIDQLLSFPGALTLVLPAPVLLLDGQPTPAAYRYPPSHLTKSLVCLAWYQSVRQVMDRRRSWWWWSWPGWSSSLLGHRSSCGSYSSPSSPWRGWQPCTPSTSFFRSFLAFWIIELPKEPDTWGFPLRLALKLSSKYKWHDPWYVDKKVNVSATLIESTLIDLLKSFKY